MLNLRDMLPAAAAAVQVLSYDVGETFVSDLSCLRHACMPSCSNACMHMQTRTLTKSNCF